MHPNDPVSRLPANARATLARWHQLVAARDASALPSLLADNVVFRSPFVWQPYAGKAETHHLLATVLTVFEDFKYHRTFTSDTGCVLEFSARVGDKSLFGVDLIEFDTAGLIADFVVMIRPHSGLQALSAEMAKRLAASPGNPS